MRPAQEEHVETTGANLVRVLNSIQAEDRALFDRIVAHLKSIVPGIVDVRVPLRGENVTVLIAEPYSRTEMMNVSTGTQQILILVTSLLTYPENSVVLLEEPEIHLHANSQRRLFSLLSLLAGEKQHQFLITSHSTIFTGEGSGIKTFLVTKPDGTSRVIEVKERNDMQLIKYALGHENSDLYGYNGILVLEGESEAIAIPLMAAAMNIDFIRKGIRILNLRGADKIGQLRALLDYVKNADVRFHMVLDRKKDLARKIGDLVREGLLREQDVSFWDGDFEENFDDNLIASAFNNFAKGENMNVEISADDVSKARAGGSVVRFLSIMFYQAAQRGLEKPALAEHLVRLQLETKLKGDTPIEKLISSVVKKFGLE